MGALLVVILSILDPLFHALGLAHMGVDPHAIVTPTLPAIAEAERLFSQRR